jgi:hypothetical protein
VLITGIDSLTAFSDLLHQEDLDEIHGPRDETVRIHESEAAQVKPNETDRPKANPQTGTKRDDVIRIFHRCLHSDIIWFRSPCTKDLK